MKGKIISYSAIAAFAMSYLFDWLYHGVILLPMYEQTASLWRPMQEMEALMPFCVMWHLLRAIIIAWILVHVYEARGTADYLRFGLYLGLLMGILPFGSYVYMPIPIMLAVAWLAGGVFLGLLISMAVVRVYNRFAPAGAART